MSDLLDGQDYKTHPREPSPPTAGEERAQQPATSEPSYADDHDRKFDVGSHSHPQSQPDAHTHTDAGTAAAAGETKRDAGDSGSEDEDDGGFAHGVQQAESGDEEDQEEGEDQQHEEAPVAKRDSRAAEDHEDEQPDHEDAAVDGDRHGRDDEEDEEEEEQEQEEGEGEGEEEGEGEGEEEGEEDEEEEEEEEDEGEETTKRPRKRRRGDILRNFFEEEAAVDDVEDEDEEEVGELIADTHPDDVDLPTGADVDDRRHRELDRQRDLASTMDAEQQAQLLKERYGRNRMNVGDITVVPKRLLLPSVNDPNIWAVKCRPSKEKEAVFNIMKRMEERPAGSRLPCRIISAFERGAISPGYVYVEARRQMDVVEGLLDLPNVYVRSKMTLISLKEMPDLLRVKKNEDLQPGGWVRIKRGKYQGDLAQVEDVEMNGLTVTVRLVPRLDYGLNEDANAAADSKRKRGGFTSVALRPPQRLFSEAEARKRHAKYLSVAAGYGGRSFHYLNDVYVDGFLLKDVKLQHLITKNVDPQLDEVIKFAKGADDGTSNLDLSTVAATIRNTTHRNNFNSGEFVEVFEGEQSGIVGKIVDVSGDIATFEVTEGELAGQRIDAPARTLRKRFREGDHVKVIGGSRYRNELGMVIAIQGDKVTLIRDNGMEEMTVFSKDLGETHAYTGPPPPSEIKRNPIKPNANLPLPRRDGAGAGGGGGGGDGGPPAVPWHKREAGPSAPQQRMQDAFQQRRGPRDRWIGKTVSIRRGPYKGLIGIVKNATDARASVELHAKSTLVDVDKQQLLLKDPFTGATLDQSVLYKGRGAYGAPNNNNNRPSAPRESWHQSGRTPAYNQGGRTAYGGGGGGATAYGGGATAYGGGGATAYGGGGGGTAYGGGGATAYGGGATAYGGGGGGGGGATAYGGPGGSTAYGGGTTPYGGGGATAYGGGTAYGGAGGGGGASTYGGDGTAYGDSRTPAWKAPGYS